MSNNPLRALSLTPPRALIGRRAFLVVIAVLVTVPLSIQLFCPCAGIL